MSTQKPKPDPAAVVDLDSSDDEKAAATPNTTQKVPPQHSPAVGQQTLACRSFWKAGDYVVPKQAFLAQDQLEHARVHPKFLHSNATSHKWAFGAIAELLDNGVDEIRNGATFVSVDKIDLKKDNSPALTEREFEMRIVVFMQMMGLG